MHTPDANTGLTKPHEKKRRSARYDSVNALARGLAVLQSFDHDNRRMTLSQVAERTGLSRATARRLLWTLNELGYLGTDQKLFWLQPKVLQLGFLYLSSIGLGRVVRRIISNLTEEIGEATSVSVLDGKHVVYIARAETRRMVSVEVEIGARVPAHWTATGQVLLAALDEAGLEAWLNDHQLQQATASTITDKQKLRARLEMVRRQGYCLVNGEFEVGVRSLAVPILNQSGQTVAGLNVGTLAARISMREMKRRYLPVLRETAHQMSQLLL